MKTNLVFKNKIWTRFLKGSLTTAFIPAIVFAGTLISVPVEVEAAPSSESKVDPYYLEAIATSFNISEAEALAVSDLDSRQKAWAQTISEETNFGHHGVFIEDGTLYVNVIEDDNGVAARTWVDQLIATGQATEDEIEVKDDIEHGVTNLRLYQRDVDEIAKKYPDTIVSWGANEATDRLDVTIYSLSPDAPTVRAELAEESHINIIETNSVPDFRASGPALEPSIVNTPTLGYNYAVSGGGCTLGFPMVSSKSGLKYVVTAGHCLNNKFGEPVIAIKNGQLVEIGNANDHTLLTQWEDQQDIGLLVMNENFTGTNTYKFQNQTTSIVGQHYAVKGAIVCNQGGRPQKQTISRCGKTTALDKSFHAQENILLTQDVSNICTQDGESGGPVVSGSGDHAAGIISRGSNYWWGGCWTSYEPISELWAAYPNLDFLDD